MGNDLINVPQEDYYSGFEQQIQNLVDRRLQYNKMLQNAQEAQVPEPKTKLRGKGIVRVLFQGLLTFTVLTIITAFFDDRDVRQCFLIANPLLTIILTWFYSRKIDSKFELHTTRTLLMALLGFLVVNFASIDLAYDSLFCVEEYTWHGAGIGFLGYVIYALSKI